MFFWVLCSFTFGECFRFPKPIRKPLSELPLPAGQKEASKSGTIPDAGVFAEIHAIVDRPIAEVKKAIDDPYFTRNPDNTSVEIKVDKNPYYLNYQHVTVKVKVFAFISISWDEDWATELLSGTPGVPSAVLYSYEKITGTTHLRRKCGSIRVMELSPKTTDIYWYENVDASRWSEENAFEHLVNTIHEHFYDTQPKAEGTATAVKDTTNDGTPAPVPAAVPAPAPSNSGVKPASDGK